jgi:hypothetical protein
LDFYTLCGYQAQENHRFSLATPLVLFLLTMKMISRKANTTLKNLFNDSGGYGKINKGGEETGLRNIPWR